MLLHFSTFMHTNRKVVNRRKLQLDWPKVFPTLETALKLSDLLIYAIKI